VREEMEEESRAEGEKAAGMGEEGCWGEPGCGERV
jgi:hypothetical protein